MRFGKQTCFLRNGIRRTLKNLYCHYSSMIAIFKLGWSMKEHFNTFTEVGRRVNECNSDFLHWTTASRLFSDYLFIDLAVFFCRTKGTPCFANMSKKKSNQIHCYRLWLKWKRFLTDLPLWRVAEFLWKGKRNPSRRCIEILNSLRVPTWISLDIYTHCTLINFTDVPFF